MSYYIVQSSLVKGPPTGLNETLMWTKASFNFFFVLVIFVRSVPELNVMHFLNYMEPDTCVDTLYNQKTSLV